MFTGITGVTTSAVTADDNKIASSYIVTFNAALATGKSVSPAAIVGAFTDAAGVPVVAEDTAPGLLYKTWMEDSEKPYIVSVIAVDEKTIEIVYNEAIQTAGTYNVYVGSSSTGNTWTTTIKKNTLSDTVLLTTTGAMTSDETYKVKVVTKAKDRFNKIVPTM